MSTGLILSVFIHFKAIKEDYLIESDLSHNAGNKKVFSYCCMESNNLCLTNVVLSLEPLTLRIQYWERPILF